VNTRPRGGRGMSELTALFPKYDFTAKVPQPYSLASTLELADSSQADDVS